MTISSELVNHVRSRVGTSDRPLGMDLDSLGILDLIANVEDLLKREMSEAEIRAMLEVSIDGLATFLAQL